MGAMNQMNKFIPSLANLCALPLKKDRDWVWNEEHDKTFKKIKEAIKSITGPKHFEKKLPLRI